jgi:hypothetical protein
MYGVGCAQDAKKWSDRKAALEALHEVLGKPKLLKGDYSNVVRLLKKVRAYVHVYAGVCLYVCMCVSGWAWPR